MRIEKYQITINDVKIEKISDFISFVMEAGVVFENQFLTVSTC